MQCRNCGTEIADKAIVCYRCGVSTTEPLRKPAALQNRGSGLPLVAALLPLLLSLALVAGAGASGHPKELDIAAAVLAAGGVVMLIARLARRR